MIVDLLISVFNIMALLLVLGIGIDYALFLRESRGSRCDTLLSVGLCMCTTVLSFGLLSLSSTAAIASLDRKSTRLNSSHVSISYAVFCFKKKIFNLYLCKLHP